jgi:hypothetical protein
MITKLRIDSKLTWQFSSKNKTQLKISHANQIIFFNLIKVKIAKEKVFIKGMFLIN